MSESQNDRLARKIKQLQDRIDEEKRLAEPLSNSEFEQGEHLRHGGIILNPQSPTLPPFPPLKPGCV